MLILTIRTDRPVAELGLFEDINQLSYLKWTAHRQLSQTIHLHAKSLLKTHRKKWSDLNGIVCFKGPGSFTGLRIGLAVANSLANSLNIPIVGQSGVDWLKKALKKVLAGKNDRLVLPEYGQAIKTT